MLLLICLIKKLTLSLHNVYPSINEVTERSYNEKVAVSNKLHRQFEHSTSEKLKKFIKSSNIDDENC